MRDVIKNNGIGVFRRWRHNACSPPDIDINGSEIDLAQVRGSNLASLTEWPNRRPEETRLQLVDLVCVIAVTRLADVE
jgi:hypothetical protein